MGEKKGGAGATWGAASPVPADPADLTSCFKGHLLSFLLITSHMQLLITLYDYELTEGLLHFKVLPFFESLNRLFSFVGWRHCGQCHYEPC